MTAETGYALLGGMIRLYVMEKEKKNTSFLLFAFFSLLS